jgi:DUF1365 family protein
MNSAFYVGNVMHRRYKPVRHQFVYRISMPCLDLDEIPALCKDTRGFGTQWWQPARFRRDDYIGTGDLKSAVFNKLYELTGCRLRGRVMLLCQLRYLGIYFSPVNFYYCFDEADNWRYLLAEVSNTPWNERHYYAIPAGEDWRHEKTFHVSPFNPMNQQYQWKMEPLGQDARLSIQVLRDNKEFEAGIDFQRHELSSNTFCREMIRMPLMPVKILWGIYSHAYRLWRKNTPFHSHPENTHTRPARSTHVSEQ